MICQYSVSNSLMASKVDCQLENEVLNEFPNVQELSSFKSSGYRFTKGIVMLT